MFSFPLTKKGVLRRRQENPVDTEVDSILLSFPVYDALSSIIFH